MANDTPIRILLVEDSVPDAVLLETQLETLSGEFCFSIKHVDRSQRALEELKTHLYDVVLLDYKLPGADGIDVLKRIQDMMQARAPAVIMLTGMGGETIAVEAMKNGAKDYLSKNSLDGASLKRAITGAMERKLLEEKLARSTNELREKNAQMQADLNMAREIQLALLPRRYPCFPRAADPAHSALRFHHRYRPTVTLGGDFFDVLAISDTLAGVFICDVMGHGVRSAMVTAMVRTLLEGESAIAGEPGPFLTAINRHLHTIFKQAGVSLFTTAFYLVADIAKGEMRYSSAGHPSPFHLRAGRSVVEPFSFPDSRHGPALALFENAVYSTAKCVLSAGDRAILYTDGLYEVEGANEELYGLERCLAAIQKRAHVPLGQLFDELLSEIKLFSITGNFTDDVCLLGMEVSHLHGLPPDVTPH